MHKPTTHITVSGSGPTSSLRSLLKLSLGIVFVLSLSFAVTSFVVAQGNYTIAWWTIHGGGASSGGGYTLLGAAGQPNAAGAMTGGGYTLESGFWAGAGGTTETVGPLPAGSPIFLPLITK